MAKNVEHFGMFVNAELPGLNDAEVAEATTEIVDLANYKSDRTTVKGLFNLEMLGGKGAES